MADPITEEAARVMRKLWFDYLDAIGPIRPGCTPTAFASQVRCGRPKIWCRTPCCAGSASLRRGDMNPGRDPDGVARRWFDRPQAYLCQIATNLWIDHLRRSRREVLAAKSILRGASPGVILTPAAGAALFERTSPQERAAVVLKDVFDFSLGRSPTCSRRRRAAVKAALHRGRGQVSDRGLRMPSSKNPPASRELVERFIAAFVART